MKNILIQKTVEDKFISVLTDGKVLLQFTLASVIEALRRNPDKRHDLLISNTSSTSSAQESPLLHIDGYEDMILDEANRFFDRLLKHFTETIMDNAAGTSSSDPTHYYCHNHHILHSQTHITKFIATE